MYLNMTLYFHVCKISYHSVLIQYDHRLTPIIVTASHRYTLAQAHSPVCVLELTISTGTGVIAN